MKKWMLSVCAVILSLSLAGSASAYCASGSQVQSNVRTYTVYGAGQPGSLPASGDLSDLVRGILNGTQSAACPATGETDSETASACPEASAEQNCANPSGQNTDALPAAADTEEAAAAPAAQAETPEEEAAPAETAAADPQNSCTVGYDSAACEDETGTAAACDENTAGNTEGYLARLCGDLPASLRDLLNGLFARLGIGQDLFGADQEDGTAATVPAEPENAEEPAETEVPAQDDAAAVPAQEETAENPAQQETNTQQADNLSFEEQVAVLVNEARAENGLAPLTLNSELSDVARLKSQDMHDNGYFDHTSPTYGDPFEMLRSFGISYRAAGENIAMGYATPEAVVTAWMNSPGHRANILNASYTQIGVGYVADGNYWTQEFIG